MESHRPVHDARGSALFAAIWLVLLLSAVGLGLALTSSLEVPVARNFESGWAAFNAAEAGLVLAAHDLASVSDWSTALSGFWRPSVLQYPPPGELYPLGSQALSLEELTHLADCRRAGPCTDADRAEATLDRPWGLNNASWVPVGALSAGPGVTVEQGIPFRVLVWVGDDPAEADSDPGADGAPSPSEPGRPSLGLGRLLLRAEAFGPRGAHATVEVTATRSGPGQAVRLRNWAIL